MDHLSDLQIQFSHRLNILYDKIMDVVRFQAAHFMYILEKNFKKILNITNAKKKKKYAQGPISSTYLSLADILVIPKFKVIIFKLLYKIVPWAVAAKLISSECHRTSTHWGGLTHICVSILGHHSWRYQLVAWRRQANIWTNAKIFSIWTSGTNFSEITPYEIQQISYFSIQENAF